MNFIPAFFLTLISTYVFAGHHEQPAAATSVGANPFILIARVQVKEGFVDEYLQIAETVDSAVERTEPGMLFHNFDADPNDPLAFTWTEVYKNSDAFLLHTSNPPVLEYVGKHAEFGEGFAIEIYGNVSNAVLANIAELGFPLKHFKTTRVGYARSSMSESQKIPTKTASD
jgi:quinol monooxygenase YgiN